MKVMVIVNPWAGKGNTLKKLPKIKRMAQKTGHHFSWSITDTVKEMQDLILSAPAERMEAIFLLGGDGTIHQALPALIKSNLPLGLIPLGRGNDFARNIGLSLDIKKNPIFSDNFRCDTIDSPLVNGIPFVSIASVGFDALVTQLAGSNKGYFQGTPGYVVCVLRALKQFSPIEVKVTVDEFSWQGKIMLIAVANGPYYGGGMKIAPQASMNSGEFSVCIIKEISKLNLLREFPKVFLGKHTTHPRALIKSGNSVTIEGNEDYDICADGETIGKLPARCEIKTKKIKIILAANQEF